MVKKALEIFSGRFFHMGLELRRGDFFACIFPAEGIHCLHEHIVAQKLP